MLQGVKSGTSLPSLLAMRPSGEAFRKETSPFKMWFQDFRRQHFQLQVYVRTYKQWWNTASWNIFQDTYIKSEKKKTSGPLYSGKTYYAVHTESLIFLPTQYFTKYHFHRKPVTACTAIALMVCSWTRITFGIDTQSAEYATTQYLQIQSHPRTARGEF